MTDDQRITTRWRLFLIRACVIALILGFLFAPEIRRLSTVPLRSLAPQHQTMYTPSNRNPVGLHLIDWWFLVRIATLSSVTSLLVALYFIDARRVWFRYSLVAITYLLGCGMATLVFYLIFGYFRLWEPWDGYTKWELLYRPALYIWFALNGSILPSKAYYSIADAMSRWAWPYYIAAPTVVLILHSIGAWPLLPRHSSLLQCSRCGYDLRGSKDSSHCPECGAAIPRH